MPPVPVLPPVPELLPPVVCVPPVEGPVFPPVPGPVIPPVEMLVLPPVTEPVVPPVEALVLPPVTEPVVPPVEAPVLPPVPGPLPPAALLPPAPPTTGDEVSEDPQLAIPNARPKRHVCSGLFRTGYLQVGALAFHPTSHANSPSALFAPPHRLRGVHQWITHRDTVTSAARAIAAGGGFAQQATGPSACYGCAVGVGDRLFQLGYICAYRLMRLYWSVRHPVTHGALVALWSEGEVLLVKNSYVDYYSLPGGYLRRGETARHGAIRELAEEVGVRVRPDELRLSVEECHEWEHKHDHVTIFELEIITRPNVRVDHREVVEAGFFTPARALELDLFPPLRRSIERHGQPPPLGGSATS
jgi:8-oxo-dGTP diphosphatase